MPKYPTVTIDENITFQLPIHKVLLTFQDDSEAESFHDWWNETGLKAFEIYLKANGCCCVDHDNYCGGVMSIDDW